MSLQGLRPNLQQCVGQHPLKAKHHVQPPCSLTQLCFKVHP
jgi:hypothetical protein